MGLTRRLGDLDLHSTDNYGVEWIVQEVTGWGMPASSREFTLRSRRSGAWPSSGYSKNRNVAINGTITADSSAQAAGALDRLYEEISREPVRLVIDEGSGERWVDVLQTDEVLPVWINDYTVQYSLQVASTDWRKFGDSLQGSTALPSTSGGLVIGGSDTGSADGLYTADQVAASANAAGLMIQPSSTPGTYDLFNSDGTPASATYVNALSLTGALTVPFTIGATVQTGQVPIENPGNTSGPVIVRIDGPCVGPVITHSETGRSVAFSDAMTLRAGEFLLIDMEAHTVLANGQASRDGYITKRGWSSLRPGDNTWSFTARQFNSQARMTVTAVPSWR